MGLLEMTVLAAMVAVTAMCAGAGAYLAAAWLDMRTEAVRPKPESRMRATSNRVIVVPAHVETTTPTRLELMRRDWTGRSRP